MWRTLRNSVEKRETPPDHVTECDVETALKALGFEIFEHPTMY